MSCGGSMMRASVQPLAHLVDAEAEKWLAVENAGEQDRQVVRDAITRKLRIGERPEITFHGLKYLLTIIRDPDPCRDKATGYTIEVHEIVQNG